MILLYFSIGAIVAAVGLYMIIKTVPPFEDEVPSFADFAFVVAMCAFMFVVGATFWPLSLIVGGLWLIWHRLYGDDKAEEL